MDNGFKMTIGEKIFIFITTSVITVIGLCITEKMLIESILAGLFVSWLLLLIHSGED